MPSCKNCKKQFDINDKHREFYKRMDVPEPTHCPVCRMQRRLAFRNERSLYKAKSSKSGKDMISMYNPENGFVVYEQKEWWSDDWDPLDYGRDFDFSRPFFEQYVELREVVPRFNVFNKGCENSDYVNYATYNKNSYLVFGCWFNEDIFYSQTLTDCKDCFDSLFMDKSELCYQNIDSNNNYQSFFCQNSNNLTDCYFCYDCKNCNKCIGCWNLRNKEYYIFNKPATKE